jgi:hypothetical protein
LYEIGGGCEFHTIHILLGCIIGLVLFAHHRSEGSCIISRILFAHHRSDEFLGCVH